MYRNIWIIARHEYLSNLRRTGFIVMTALVPLLGTLGLLVASLFGGQASSFLARAFVAEPQAVGVVDHSGQFTPILPEYQDRFRLFADEPAGREALQADQISALLVIPTDYVDGGQGLAISKGSGFSAAISEDSKTMRAFFVDHLVRDKLDDALRRRLAKPVDLAPTSLAAAGSSAGRPLSTILNMMVPYFMGIMLIVTIFTSSGYLLRSVTEEKTSRVIEIVLSSISATELLAGKVIGLGALGLTQIVVWLLSALGLSGGAVSLLGIAAIPLFSRPEIFLLAIVYFLLGFLVYAVLMASVGALGTTMQESQQLAGIFSLMAALPMMLAGFVFTNPNMILLRVFSWIPLTAPMMMLLRLPMTSVPALDIVISIGGALIAIPAILWAGARVFRMGLLMYGKRPTFAQVWMVLRHS